jgi:hypothetical protein
VPVSSSEEEDVHDSKEKMGMIARKNMHMTARKMVESKIIGMLTVTK